MSTRANPCASCHQEFGFHSVTCSIWPPKPTESFDFSALNRIIKAVEDGRVYLEPTLGDRVESAYRIVIEKGSD